VVVGSKAKLAEAAAKSGSRGRTGFKRIFSSFDSSYLDLELSSPSSPVQILS
jgi:hypothetical protein